MTACRLEFIFILLMLGLPAVAQRMIVRPMPFFNKLASNEIFYIHQDAEGFMWIGTTNGVARYDGSRLVTFRSDRRNPALLTDNTMSCITDNSCYVWLGTRGGLNLFDKKTYSVKPFPHPALRTANINAMACGKNGVVWICTNKSVFRSSADGASVKEYRLFTAGSNSSVTSVYVDRHGSVWALTFKGGLFKYCAKNDLFEPCPRLGEDNSPYVMFEDKEHNYWIGTWGEGLWQFFPDGRNGGHFRRHRIINNKTGKSDPVIYSIAQDETFGYLWMLSYKELYALKNEGSSLQPVDISGTVDTRMMYTHIAKDHEGNLWIEAYDKACIISFDRSGIDNYSLPQIESETGHDTNLLCLCNDTDGKTIWVGQDRYGLMAYDMKDNAFLREHSEVKSFLGEVCQIRQSARGGVWVRSRSASRITRMKRNGNDLIMAEKVDLEKKAKNCGAITNFEEDGDGNLWILTPRKIFVLQKDGKLIRFNNHRTAISLLAKDATGRLWALTRTNRVCSINFHENLLIMRYVGCVPPLDMKEMPIHACIDTKGCIWLTTTLENVLKSDPGKTRFSKLDLARLTGTSTAKGCVADGVNVWIITNKSIIRYDGYHDTFKSYDTGDENIRVNVFRFNAYSPDGEGGVYVGGYLGFVHINANAGQMQAQRSIKPALSDVSVNGESLFFFAPDTVDNTSRDITLWPGASDIEIAFSPMVYAADSKVYVAYKLEGVDSQWIYPKEGGYSAVYNKIPIGSHRFWVMTQTDGGQCMSEIALLTITQKPALYEAWYARIAYIVLLIAISILVLKAYATRRLRKDKARRREEQNLKESIFSNNDNNTFQTTVNNTATTSADCELLRTATNAIEKNLSETDFDLNKLAEATSISRSTLHRKLKSLTGMTPLDFINNIRMKHACRLLALREMTISEVAYAVGFSNPKYFTKCFKEQFGVTPTEFQRNLND